MPKIIVDHAKLTEGFIEPTETVFIVGRGDKSGVVKLQPSDKDRWPSAHHSPALYVQQLGRGYRPRRVRWWNHQLGPYYTVGQSLACAAVLLILFAAMLAVWAS